MTNDARSMEIEAIQSIYYKEFSSDSNVFSINDPSKTVRFYFRALTPLNNNYEATFDLSASYPSHTHPTVLIRSSLSRFNSQQLDRDLAQFIFTLSLGDPMLGEIINWLTENADRYFTTDSQASVENAVKASDMDALNVQTRFWIYTHHMYNIKKRKTILSTAEELKVGGFSAPGKPGIICVEGSGRCVAEFWKLIRSLSWQKITLRHEEDLKDKGRVFSDFKEVYFNSNIRNHLDTTALLEFLRNNKLEYAFNYLFDVKA